MTLVVLQMPLLMLFQKQLTNQMLKTSMKQNNLKHIWFNNYSKEKKRDPKCQFLSFVNYF